MLLDASKVISCAGADVQSEKEGTKMPQTSLIAIPRFLRSLPLLLVAGVLLTVAPLSATG
jgi:hypothetical protein